VRVQAPAKLNLLLAVLAREVSGYHQLETVFCRLELADELDVQPSAAGVQLTVEGPEPAPPEQNLAVRAARAFLERSGVAGGAAIRLVKRIPVGAGLGGGSSDAAATLLALNRLHDLPLQPTELLELGAALGSDVPFFLADTALALAWGRGERLLPLEPLPRMEVLLAVPPFAIPTAWAYDRWDAAGSPAPAGPRLHRAADFRTWTALTPHAANDFEAAVFPEQPRLPALKRALQASGAFLALLTGSGSALYGLFRTPGALREARLRLVPQFEDVAFLETRTDAGGRPDLLG
jgi:4-diphosphocytidyl-2-C-methyl-D-erythritol kinase